MSVFNNFDVLFFPRRSFETGAINWSLPWYPFMMRIMPRVLLLLFVFSTITMMFIARCGLNMDIQATQGQGQDGRSSNDLDQNKKIAAQINYAEILNQKEQQYTAEINRLRQEILDLRKQFDSEKRSRLVLRSVANSENNANQPATGHLQQRGIAMPPLDGKNKVPSDEEIFMTQVFNYDKREVLGDFLKEKLKDGELIQGIGYNHEYEMFPFCRFTLTRLYMLDPGLGKRVVEKPIGYKKKDFMEVISYGAEKLNKEFNINLKTDDFAEGIYRTEPSIGTHYELYFHDSGKTKNRHYRKITVMRPFGPLITASTQVVDTSKTVINIILPLSGRISTFQTFMARFIKVCILRDKHVYLTVVYFGHDGLSEVKSLLSKISKRYRFKHIKLVTLNEKFSRGRGLQIGAQAWVQGDVLMFLCDVDIVFSLDFLERCRMNAEQGKRVYYPIVFSLYNPKVVYSLQDMVIPSEHEQLTISRDTGFWRDFGYGMTCQYRSDFLRIKGFDEKIIGWGMEDVQLYRKYIKSKIMVIRATDPGIFHVYHEKACDPQLPKDQYRSCIHSKSLNEASHAQLGMLAFKDEIDIHKAAQKKARGR